jgi:hypothetical protein
MFNFRPMRQHAKEYRGIPYNGKDLNDSGCAILTMANAYRCLTGIKLNVHDLIKLANDNGCAVPGVGTRWRYIFVFSEKYNLDVELIHDIKKTMDAVNDGAVAIVSAHSKNQKIFTTEGHWMTLASVKGSGFVIFDANFKAKTFTRPNARNAAKNGQLKIMKRSVWADAKLLASEIKTEFPEPKNCETFVNMPFGAAVLRIKK